MTRLPARHLEDVRDLGNGRLQYQSTPAATYYVTPDSDRWRVHDCAIERGHLRRVELESPAASSRLFVGPPDTGGLRKLYRFTARERHELSPAACERQLARAELVSPPISAIVPRDDGAGDHVPPPLRWTCPEGRHYQVYDAVAGPDGLTAVGPPAHPDATHRAFRPTTGAWRLVERRASLDWSADERVLRALLAIARYWVPGELVSVRVYANDPQIPRDAWTDRP